MATLPVFAPVGTVAVTCVSELTVTAVAFTPPNVTFEVCTRSAPVITTGVPTGPLGGLNPTICGVTRNFTLLFSVPVFSLTVTAPVFAQLGTVAVK
jgi:hypothetical protein